MLTAFNGESALHMLRSERPDLLVLDLMLPDRDGWDITRLIRSDERLSATPRVALTLVVPRQPCDSLLRDIGLKDGRGSSPERIDKPG